MSKYQPEPDDSLITLIHKAEACGRNLAPEDSRANWIDDHPEADVLTCAYHGGQAEQFCNEDW